MAPSTVEGQQVITRVPDTHLPLPGARRPLTLQVGGQGSPGVRRVVARAGVRPVIHLNSLLYRGIHLATVPEILRSIWNKMCL